MKESYSRQVNKITRFTVLMLRREILWKYNPGTQLGYWVSGSAVAYDMVYELNKDGNLYALDVNTGNVVWKYEGPGYLFWPGWPVVADGKIYATTGQRASIDPYTLEYSESEFVCLDAYTGDLIWELPIEASCSKRVDCNRVWKFVYDSRPTLKK